MYKSVQGGGGLKTDDVEGMNFLNDPQSRILFLLIDAVESK